VAKIDRGKNHASFATCPTQKYVENQNRNGVGSSKAFEVHGITNDEHVDSNP